MPSLSTPSLPITGSKKHRNMVVKAHWLRELGGRCVYCKTVLQYRNEWVSNKTGGGHYARKANLHAHHLGDTTGVGRQDRLANLYVPSAKDPQNQKRKIEAFKANLERCLLLCASCHGSLHAS